MNKRIGIIGMICCLMLSCTNKYKEMANTDQDYQIIPKPVKLDAQTGKFLIDSKTTVSGEASLVQEGELLAGMLGAATGETIEFSEGDGGNISLVLDSEIQNEEGYKLVVSYDKITI